MFPEATVPSSPGHSRSNPLWHRLPVGRLQQEKLDQSSLLSGGPTPVTFPSYPGGFPCQILAFQRLRFG